MTMKVVIGMDGSKYSEWALDWVGKMPFRAAPRVAAIHSIDLNSARVPALTYPSISGYEPDIGEAIHLLESRAKQVELSTKKRLSALGLTGTVRVEQGPIAQALLKHAGSTALIVVGSRGLDAIDRFMLGSVSTAVTLHATTPVLIVKEPPHSPQRILFATDGSAASGKALQFLLKRFKASADGKPLVILLVHVMPFLRYTAVKEAGEQLLAQEAAKLEKIGYRVRQFPRVGPAAEEIMKVVNLEQPDLIVTGAKGRGAIARFLQGSVSLKLVQQTACSVLVVR
ncbi:MAG: universal stress protein [Nitrospira sp.]|nr:universal stress protein [Nitrospira sp.]MDH4303770.1 universal stress protein [Nitrospira sp.]MDH5193037.1 universal stress protein [Nitrospira sp.]